MTPIPLHHGAIGNGRVLALVGPDTSIDWLCLPRFDSPSMFARLLDQENGGSWAFLGIDTFSAKSEYIRNTNVLRTEVTTESGRFEIIDFAPRIPLGLKVDAPIEVCRLLRPIEGMPRARMRFDAAPRLRARAGRNAGVGSGPRDDRRRRDACISGPTSRPHYIQDGSPFRIDRPVFLSLSAGRVPTVDSGPAAESALEQTMRGWRQWAKTCALPSFAPETVLRSALCLKLHAYVDTGAIIAAATTSIPEAIGSGRTWDYRYCWLRDAAFVVEALRRLCHLTEGEQFISFLRDVADAGPLQPLYGIAGERALAEQVLTNLRGYDGIGPVRIGNAADAQQQNDLNGELILCLETILGDPRVVWEDPSLAPLLERLVEEAIASSPSKTPGCGSSARCRATTRSRGRCAGWRRIAAR